MNKEENTVTLDSIMSEKNKQLGKNTMMTGNSIIYSPSRIPFGVFPIDYCIGGGIPIWGSTCLWGPKGGGKSTLIIKMIKTVTMLCWRCFNYLSYCTCSTKPLKMKAAVADVEGTLDIEWMETQGVTKDLYYLILGECAEEYFDVAESCLQADDCGIAVIDSLGGSTPSAEMDRSLIDANMGKHAQLITKTVRKFKQRLMIEKKRLHPCTVIYTNQMRSDLQKMFGSKESLPGGHASIHEYSLVLRCVGKALTDLDKKKFLDKEREIAKVSRHSVSVRNSKISTLSGVSEFVLVKENINEHNLTKGEIDDYAVVIKYGQEVGIIQNDKKVKISGIESSYDSIKDLIKFFKENREEYLKIQQSIVNEYKKNT